MVLFTKKDEKPIEFNADDIFLDIVGRAPVECNDWIFMKVKSLFAPNGSEYGFDAHEFLAIKTIAVKEQYVNELNPFSKYEAVLDKKYQIVVMVRLCHRKDFIGYSEDDIGVVLPNYVEADSAKMLFSRLKEFVNV